jgi:MFS family permease
VATREARTLSQPTALARPWYSKILTDLGPARRSPAYRRLLLGQLVSQSGTQLTLVALPVQIFALTNSSLNVGLLGLVTFFPLLVGGLYGGAIADSMDRRKLAILTSIGLAATSGLLVLQAVLELHSVAVLYVLAALMALLAGVDSPARSSIIPRLVPLTDLPAAGALSYASMTLATTVGPLVAGLLISGPGLGITYGVDTLSYVAALYSVWRLPALLPEGGGTKASSASVLEGLRFLRTQPVLTMTFAVDLVAMIFGMPRALFPALAVHRFGGGARTVGLLYTALAAGGLIGTIFGGWFSRVSRQGRRHRRLRPRAVADPSPADTGGLRSRRRHQRRLPRSHSPNRHPRPHARPAARSLRRRGQRRPPPRRPGIRRRSLPVPAAGSRGQRWHCRADRGRGAGRRRPQLPPLPPRPRRRAVGVARARRKL